MRAILSVLIISFTLSMCMGSDGIRMPEVFSASSITTSTHPEQHHAFSKNAKPRKKVKKKRQTILNRKTKKGHGHHCPSF